MITIYLQGGIGNTLFQIAAAIGTAEKLHCDYVIPSSWKYKNMFAGEFNFRDVSLPRYHEPNFHYNEITKTDIELFGYFQSKKYFQRCENKIKRLFAPSRQTKQYIQWKYDKLLQRKNTCSIHVRRGDYLQLQEYHYNLEPSYYEGIQAMFPDFYYVCFSDDIEWCTQNIKADFFVSDSTENEFHLMCMMKNNIMANSSFSWWAQELNPNKEKLVFAPPKNQWFGEKKSHLNVDDLYCEYFIYEKVNHFV